MIPLADPQIGDPERERIEDVLESGQLADGPEVRAFEAEFADYCGAAEGIACANGTAALHAALAGLEVGEGDAVVTSPFTFVATANAVRLRGGEPVFADVDPETYTLDPDAVAEIVRGRDDVAAILAVHLYGLPAPMDELRAIADENDVALIEDAAQAHGAELDGRRVGSLGDAACFSFYPTKNMTTGEGGMVLTDDESVADRVRRFVDHGREDGVHEAVGHNFRLSSIAAAIGRAQLRRLPELVTTRREHAAELTETIDAEPVETPVEPPGYRHSYNQYTIRVPDRDGLRAYLDERGIDTGVYYPRAVHQEPAYEEQDVSLPTAERLADSVLSVPVHPGLDRDDVETIATTINQYYE